MKKFAVFFLLIPFVYSTFNIQGLITHFMSLSRGQMSAYVMVAFVIIGSALLIKQRESLPKQILLWIWFFVFYFVFGTIADFSNDIVPSYLKAFIPVIYFVAFSLFLSIPANRPIFINTAMVTFFIATVAIIYLERINFSMDSREVLEYKMDRAGGLYGDPNQAALMALLTTILIFYKFKAGSKLLKLVKAILLAVSVYALILTFSKTGFVVLLIVFTLSLYKMFNVRRILVAIFIVPIILIWIVNSALNSESLSMVQKQRIENVVNLITLNTEKVEFSSRDVLLQRMLEYVYDNPVIGNGISFSNKIRGHNTIVGVWADSGILTFIIFIIILFRYYLKSWLSPGETRYFALSIISVLVVFMLSLQTVINQPYLITIFVYLAFLTDTKPVEILDEDLSHDVNSRSQIVETK